MSTSHPRRIYASYPYVPLLRIPGVSPLLIPGVSLRIIRTALRSSLPVFARVRFRPLLGHGDGGVFVREPVFRDFLGKRIGRVRRRKQGLDGNQHRPYLQRGGPFIFQNVQADAAERVDVGVVYLREEAHFRGGHGVLLWEKQLQFEHPAVVRRVLRAQNVHREVTQVAFLRLRAYPGARLQEKALGLLFFLCFFKSEKGTRVLRRG